MSADTAASATPTPAVVHADERPLVELGEGDALVSVRIDLEGVGAPNLVQRVIELPAGGSVEQRHDASEDVVYVASGSGEARVGEQEISLRPGLGFVVQMGVTYRIEAVDPLRLVSVLSPPPGRPSAVSPSTETDEEARPWVHESEEEVIAAGDDEARDWMDRYFKLMVDPRHSAHYVTQFIGFIERSKAPPHTHTYDEVIYILDGEGVVHIDDGSHPITAGDSVYLPPGSVHCLENPSDTPLALLGVFCPAGSPKEREKA